LLSLPLWLTSARSLTELLEMMRENGGIRDRVFYVFNRIDETWYNTQLHQRLDDLISNQFRDTSRVYKFRQTINQTLKTQLLLMADKQADEILQQYSQARAYLEKTLQQEAEEKIVNRTYALYKSTIICTNGIRSFQAVDDKTKDR
jgi:pantothenate kinase-related protein Tda10